jgi:hypothetical protein
MKFPMKYCIKGCQEGDDGGVFEIPFEGRTLNVIASTGAGWDHVSVSLNTRCPNWREMSHVKNLFWEEYEVAIQIHVSKKDHVNIHPYCLHLWQPQNENIPLPPIFMV